jgi:hypothetical protein
VSLGRFFLLVVATATVLGLLDVRSVLEVVSVRSTSPLNPFPTGSLDFVRLLDSAVQSVYFASRVSIDDVVGEMRAVYVVIGPDYPPPKSIIDVVKRYYDEGSLDLLVADETGLASSLTREVAGIEVTGHLLLRSDAGGEYAYIVPIVCGNGLVFLSTKVSSIEVVEPMEGYRYKVLCWFTSGQDRVPVAVLAENSRGSRVLVIGDSSIFANFMIRGMYGFPSSRSIVLLLVKSVFPDAKVFIVEDSLYKKYTILRASSFTARLVGAASHAVHSLGSLLLASPLRLIAALALLPPLAALRALGMPQRRKRRDVFRVEEEAYLGKVADAAKAPREGEGAVGGSSA